MTRQACILALAAMATVGLAVAQAPQQASSGGFNRAQPEPVEYFNHKDWTPIFDGRSLSGWDGDTDVWSVEAGMIVGQSSDKNPSGTTNLILTGQTFSNFRLRVEFKMEGAGANGGVQYRSRMAPPRERPVPADATPEVKARMAKAAALAKKRAKWSMAGYQADFNEAGQYVGQLYEQGSQRGIMTFPGQAVAFDGNGAKPRLVGLVATPDEVKNSVYRKDDWNQLEIIADGHTLTHILNGKVVAVSVDSDPDKSASSGLIALEIEGPGTLKIYHRNLYIKKLP